LYIVKFLIQDGNITVFNLPDCGNITDSILVVFVKSNTYNLLHSSKSISVGSDILFRTKFSSTGNEAVNDANEVVV
jgi:hypothetical protein